MKKRTFPRLLFLLLLMLTALLLCIGAAAEPQPEPEATDNLRGIRCTARAAGFADLAIGH